jgi:hypothetical protein
MVGFKFVPFLDEFAKKKFANGNCYIRDVGLCPFVLMEQLGSHWTNFREILYWICLLNSIEKI